MKNDAIAPSKNVAIRETSLEDLFKEMAEWTNRIAKRAYEFFAASGFTHGHDREDWFKAERALLLKPMALDVKDLKDEFIVRADVPGFEAKELDIHLNGTHLIIEGTREVAVEKKENDTNLSERNFQRVYRAIELPAPILADEATAELKNGVLELKLPKAAKPKQIKIAAA
jgi:HSP20 family protein